MALFPRMISQLPGGRLITFGLLSWKEQSFVLISIDYYSGYGLLFPAHNASVKITIRGLIKCLIHHYGIPYIISSDQGTRFIANALWQWAQAHGIYWSSRFS